MNQISIVLLGKSLNHLLGFLVKAVELDEIYFRQNNHEGLMLEEGLDILEERDLLLNSITTSL